MKKRLPGLAIFFSFTLATLVVGPVLLLRAGELWANGAVPFEHDPNLSEEEFLDSGEMIEVYDDGGMNPPSFDPSTTYDLYAGDSNPEEPIGTEEEGGTYDIQGDPEGQDFYGYEDEEEEPEETSSDEYNDLYDDHSYDDQY